MNFSSAHIAEFACNILGKPLYPYQAEIAEAILASVLGEHGRIFTVMMARQSGKNQLSAVLEAYLLHYMSQGTIIKAAPTFSPQILNSRLRLLSLLDTSHIRGRLWTNSGYIVGLAPQSDPALLRSQTGPRVMFYSAAPESNVMGATADLLLEIDEAQHVSREKFDRDFRPMASVRNATTILYGTAWTDATLLAQQRAVNLASEQRTAQRDHFEYDWHSLAAIKPSYRTFVEQEIARLGEEDATIQTQYLLRPVSGADLFFSPLHLVQLQGKHSWEGAPAEDECYIAGMDIGGEERPSQGKASHAGHQKRDSTVITIGRLY